MAIQDKFRQMLMMDYATKQQQQQQNGLLDQPQIGGGLLSSLGNINPNILIGASIAGQGLKGQDPFSAVIPAVTQTAQIQKLLTPKVGSLKQAYDPNKINADGSKGGVVYASDREIKQKI